MLRFICAVLYCLSQPIVESFVDRDMIAKLFRPMRMKILRHKKCFRDHRSRVPFGVTPPGRAAPKAAVLASRDA